ncbi:MAG: hypothetical protein MUF52_02495 [Syntrophobacteraceae bacterium]|jgi:hypothetical protein|nr:hypothetical protein [Syntrophobacteraceae bacterium]
MNQVVLLAFNGDPMCFMHVLLNALDMDGKGTTARIILEGASTKLIPELTRDGSPLVKLYEQAKSRGLLEGACRACSNKMGTLEAARTEGLRLLDDLSGHPSVERYREAGFEIITF